MGSLGFEYLHPVLHPSPLISNIYEAKILSAVIRFLVLFPPLHP